MCFSDVVKAAVFRRTKLCLSSVFLRMLQQFDRLFTLPCQSAIHVSESFLFDQSLYQYNSQAAPLPPPLVTSSSSSLSLSHTHTHPYLHVSMHTHAHTHTHICMSACTHMPPPHTHTYTLSSLYSSFSLFP